MAVLSASTPRATDVRISGMSIAYEDYIYRVPIKFGGTALDRVTLINAEVRVRTRDGRAFRRARRRITHAQSRPSWHWRWIGAPTSTTRFAAGVPVTKR